MCAGFALYAKISSAHANVKANLTSFLLIQFRFRVLSVPFCIKIRGCLTIKMPLTKSIAFGIEVKYEKKIRTKNKAFSDHCRRKSQKPNKCKAFPTTVLRNTKKGTKATPLSMTAVRRANYKCRVQESRNGCKNCLSYF